ncbi:hypothetical protein MPSEU_000051700 [Mayamaea pseudoterrestris]|nr:hypothetical protein MPSEU_000051700 [Mayamaea pseudoterrestris]
MMNQSFRSVLLLLLLSASSTAAFVLQQRSSATSCSRGTSCSPLAPLTSRHACRRIVMRSAADESQAAETEHDVASDVEAAADDEDVTEITSNDQDQEQDEEDSELIAMKEEIAVLEQRNKETRRQVMLVSDQADEFSKEGYARKVAEMETMRRNRSKLNSSSRSAATANVLSQFLPVLDRLEELGAKYSSDKFGRNYSALPGTMKAALTDMGVTHYEPQVGDVVDEYRMNVIATEHSESAPQQTVLRVEQFGMEIDGNVMRQATVVASLGPEQTLPGNADVDAEVNEADSNDKANEQDD